MAKDKGQSEIEKALYDVNLMKESMERNTKEILRSVAKEEIDGLVNESLYEDDEEDIDLDIDGGSEEEAGDVSTDMEPSTDFESEVGVDAGVEAGGDADLNLGADNETEEGSFDYEGGEGVTSDEDDYEFDMTTATDEEVISVFKKLSGEDEIEIIDDNEVHITDPVSGSEYHVKLKGETAVEAPMADVAPADEFGMDSEVDAEGGEEEVDYEIDLDGGDDFGSEADAEEEEEITEDIVRGKGHDTYAGGGELPSGDIEGTKGIADPDSGDNLDGGFDDDVVKHANAEGQMVMEDGDETEEEEVLEEDDIDETIAKGRAEATRVPAQANIGQPVAPGAKGHVSEADYAKLIRKYQTLVQENTDFKGALRELRTMLGDVATFNSNLTYATRLFTEHSTTKDEKGEILKRFDSEASTLAESKKVFKSIQEGLKKRTTLSESIGNKINSEPKSSSKSQINESTVYVDKSTQRMLDLMRKI